MKLGYMMTVGAVLDHKNGKTPEQPKKKWMGTPPERCDLCQNSFKHESHFIDGRTRMGPWANMCMTCHGIVGVGLGTGKGQKYNLQTLEKVEG